MTDILRSRTRAIMSMGCETYNQIEQKLQHAIEHPIEPKYVRSTPTKEVVEVGERVDLSVLVVQFSLILRLASSPALAEVILVAAGLANTRCVAFPLTARLFQQLEPWRLLPHEGPNQLPWPCVRFRVLNRNFIVDRIRVNQSQAFDQMRRVGIEVPGVIKPRIPVKVGYVDHQGVPIPAST